MSRKLWLLNFVLIAAIAAGVWRVRKDAREFATREHATLSAKVTVPPPPPALPPTPTPEVKAASYVDIAQKMLWSRDRNSQVILDPPKPKEIKPLPPLPKVHGVINLGDGPIVMMSEKQGDKHHGVHPGDMIGDFKLVSVDSENLVLAFEDRTVKKKLQELIDHSDEASPSSGGSTSGSAQGSTPQNTGGFPPPPPSTVVADAKPGVTLSNGVNNCQLGDNSPAGTVANGMRKVITPLPFGNACRWEAVK